MPDPLSPQVVRLVVDRIRSIEALEALLLLSRSPEKWWSAAAVDEELGIGAGPVEGALDHLCSHNLLDVKIGRELLFRFAPREADQPLVRELADAYRARRLAVLQLFSRPVDSVREFADAFRIGAKKKKGDSDG
jgi:hypothetical protein